MSIFEIAKAIADMETAADLLIRSSEALSASKGYDSLSDEETARELYLRALTLRVRLHAEHRDIGFAS